MEWTFSDSVRLSLLSFSEASKACAALPGFSLFRRDCHNSHGTLQTEKQRTGLNSSVSHTDGFSHFPFPALSVHSFLPVDFLRAVNVSPYGANLWIVAAEFILLLLPGMLTVLAWRKKDVL